MGRSLRTPYGACPLCESTSLAHELTADCSRHPAYKSPLPPAMVWMRCADCGHVFTDGYFTPEAAALVFSTTAANQTLGHDFEQQRYIAARMVEKVLPYIDHGTWLDVGFGNGALLFTAEEFGFSPVGIDLRAPAVMALGQLGIEAHLCDIESLDREDACAVISLADVLEHMPFPKLGLAAAHRLLADDGVLLISLPNSESVLWRRLSAANANPYWGELEHYHNFSRTRLYALLREMGFEPVRYGVSERYRAGMEILARKESAIGHAPGAAMSPRPPAPPRRFTA